MPDLTTAKAAKLDRLQLDEKQLDELIAERTERLVSLTAQSDQLRKDLALAYRDRFAPRYANFDVARSLAGYPVTHSVVIFGAAYAIQPPSQSAMHAAAAVARKGGATSITQAEEVLLAWLVSVGAEGGEMRPLNPENLEDKLPLIRKMPELVVTKLAEECANLQTYLNVCLEHELGNC